MFAVADIDGKSSTGYDGRIAVTLFVWPGRVKNNKRTECSIIPSKTSRKYVFPKRLRFGITLYSFLDTSFDLESRISLVYRVVCARACQVKDDGNRLPAMRGSNTAGAHREDRRCRIIGFVVAGGGAMIFFGHTSSSL